ncbi:MAG: ribonuclease H-like domain-containing protein [Clostridiales bacterium]|jgi:hypothetical protein|nr:ribonuclease H-like domain-containing protein [Clostridiales bacterium]
MIIRQKPVDLTLGYPLEYDRNKIVFFDIETTGFSAETTYLYLIGCIYYEDNAFHIIQWFSEGIHEEKELIRAFFEFIKNYEVLIHYNGSGFDIPYLIKKCFLLNLKYSFEDITSIDLYKNIFPYKKFLNLPNYKQKTIETFLKIKRKDIYGGGDLIEVYQSYLGKKRYETLKNRHRNSLPNEGTNPKQIEDIHPTQKPSPYKFSQDKPMSIKMVPEVDELLHLLLLHNEDDLKGLVRICPILSYTDLFEKPFHILEAGIEGDQLTISIQLRNPLPVPISYRIDRIYFNAQDLQASLHIKVVEGVLKHFYENYKDYYYLPAEDIAVHKSLASFVDKDYREKAKPATCYTKKKGSFVPQFEPVIYPFFKQNYQDKISYLEVHTDFLLQEENIEQYVSHILNYLTTHKE